MTDPAIEAAQRAWDTQNASGMRKSWAQLPKDNTFVLLQVAAAREALAPLREMHRKEPDGRYPKCPECRYDWPCATAYLIYAKNEL